jgi:hypothetical protein
MSTAGDDDGSSPIVSMRELFQKTKEAMAHVEVRTALGDITGGSAFHIGDGWFLTARHVVEGMTRVDLYPYELHFPERVNVSRILLPGSGRADIALLETDYSSHPLFGHRPAAIEIGGHLDDWLGDEFILSRVLLMGYPRIPLTTTAELVAVTGEVNAIVYRNDSRLLHFVVSSLPRLGFSGGPVLSEWGGFLLGVMTERLFEMGNTEMPYSAVLSIEPIWELLVEHGVLPGKNGEFYREYFDGLFVRSDTDERHPEMIDGEVPDLPF